MSGIHCVQEGPRFRSPHFAHDDAVWPMAKHGFEQLRRILNNEDARPGAAPPDP